MTLTFVRLTARGVETSHTVPAIHAVCEHCEGHGTHLTPSLRDHAYSAEEFAESFHEEDDRAEYCRRGRIYDVPCEVCHGARVVPVPDAALLARSLRGRRLLLLHDAVVHERAAAARERAWEQRMGF